MLLTIREPRTAGPKPRLSQLGGAICGNNYLPQGEVSVEGWYAFQISCKDLCKYVQSLDNYSQGRFALMVIKKNPSTKWRNKLLRELAGMQAALNNDIWRLSSLGGSSVQPGGVGYREGPFQHHPELLFVL